MRRTSIAALVAGMLLSIAMAGASPVVVESAITSAAGKIVANQNNINGNWTSEPDFTGTIASGLMAAYGHTGNSAYKTSAQNGAASIMLNSSLLGDEAYALTQISAVQPNPSVNVYRAAAATYF